MSGANSRHPKQLQQDAPANVATTMAPTNNTVRIVVLPKHPPNPGLTEALLDTISPIVPSGLKSNVEMLLPARYFPPRGQLHFVPDGTQVKLPLHGAGEYYRGCYKPQFPVPCPEPSDAECGLCGQAAHIDGYEQLVSVVSDPVALCWLTL